MEKVFMHCFIGLTEVSEREKQVSRETGSDTVRGNGATGPYKSNRGPNYTFWGLSQMLIFFPKKIQATIFVFFAATHIMALYCSFLTKTDIVKPS